MDSTATFFASTAYNLSLQLGLKVLTFTLNAWLIRVLSPTIIGIANVRLMLLYTTLSFLVREPFRRSCIKEEGQTPTSMATWSALVNTLWLCPLVCAPMAVFLGGVWCLWLEQPDEKWYTEAVVVYAVSLWVECLGEPFWILGQQFHYAKAKAGIEATQLFVRNVGVAILTAAFPQLRLGAFPIAMLVSSCLYTFLYIRFFLGRLKEESGRAKRRRDDNDSSPSPPPDGGLGSMTARDLFPRMDAGVDKNCLRVAQGFFSHCLLKHFLTEGERLLMTFTGILSFADQGIYDIIHNLGSLVARIVFAPLEESAHTFFSLNLRRGASINDQDPERLKKASRLLRHLLRLTMLMGLVVCVFGWNYSRLALFLYGGPVLSTGRGPRLLQLYCPYVLLLALNGISESFLFTIITPAQMTRHKMVLVGTCVGFVGVVYAGRSLGTLIFVLANSLNMLARIIFSLYHMGRYYAVLGRGSGARFGDEGRRGWEEDDGRPLLALLPGPRILLTLAGAGLMTALTELLFGLDGVFNIAAHLGFGAISLLFALFTIYASEQDLVNFIETHIVRNKAKPE